MSEWLAFEVAMPRWLMFFFDFVFIAQGVMLGVAGSSRRSK